MPVKEPSTIVSLFSGIGGFERAFVAESYVTQLSCEIDPVASAVLRAHFPRVAKHADVRTLDLRGVRADVLTAGFPCQDLSSVGPKSGMAGTRSSLVHQVFRLLERQPIEWVVFENVYFLLHVQKGNALRAILDGLEALGYRWAYRIVDSSGFGLPQRRRRIFIVAALHGDPRRVILAETHRPRTPEVTIEKPVGFYWTEGTYATGLAGNAIPPLKSGSTLGIPSPPAILMPDGFAGTPEIRDAERLQGFPADWTLPAVAETRASFRWRLVGNAVSVPVAQWLAKNIREPGTYDAAGDEPLAGSWPAAAYNVGSGRFRSAVSDATLRPKPTTGLDRFLRHDLKPLSHKAVRGFLSRAHAGNLAYPPGFLAALEKHARRTLSS